MAMSEEQAIELLASAAALAAQVSTLFPTLVSNLQAIKAGLASTDADALNAQIIDTHSQIQALDAQLQALKV
ncbi:hypothetical protein [Novosphingobium rosa]|jgi:hypothetical protein|uniref:hypothetical protein n=1 Tax=Novosphingobium rosa TaxID=76978 RepID=UPI0008299D9B|nr:hypothetical protein [Novosphingobium rosa]